MTFAAPLFLLGLLAVPAAIALHLLARRRRRRYAVRFPGAPIAALATPASSRWRRHVPAALLALSIAGLVTRARPAGDDRRRAGRAGLGRARHRHLAAR